MRGEQMKSRRILVCAVVSLIMVFVMAVPMTASATGAEAKIGDQTYSSLSDAFQNAKDGDTITVMNDVSVSDKITVSDGQSITLDLNGYDVSFDFKKHIQIQHGNLNIVGKGCIYEKQPYFSPIILYGSATNQANYSVVTVGKNITLKGWAGLFIDNNSAAGNYGIVANVYGTLQGQKDTSGDGGSALYVNGSIKNTIGNVPKITLDGAVLNNEAGTGIYLAGYADTTMKNCTVTSSSEGSSGIEIRAGKLDVTSCVITGGFGTFTASPNGNGSTSGNVALAIAQHTTKLPIEVTIHDGTLKGGAAVVQDNPQNNDDEAISKVKLNIENGFYQGTVTSKNLKNFISGGEYTQPVPDEYISSDVDVAATYEIDGMKTYLVGRADVNEKINTAEGGTITITKASAGTTLDAPKNGAALINGTEETIVVGTGDAKVELSKDQTYKAPEQTDSSQGSTTKPSGDKNPDKADETAKTGDDFHLYVVGGAALAALIIMGAVAITGRRQGQK